MLSLNKSNIDKLSYRIVSFFQKNLLKFFISFLSKKIIEKLIISLSKNKEQKLEITSTIGCTMMCSYCPQKLITTVSTNEKNQKKLDFKDFKVFVENIPRNTQINWTGYTEPLLHEDFDKFVLHLNEKKYKQAIDIMIEAKMKEQAIIRLLLKYPKLETDTINIDHLFKVKL